MYVLQEVKGGVNIGPAWFFSSAEFIHSSIRKSVENYDPGSTIGIGGTNAAVIFTGQGTRFYSITQINLIKGPTKLENFI